MKDGLVDKPNANSLTRRLILSLNCKCFNFEIIVVLNPKSVRDTDIQKFYTGKMSLLDDSREIYIECTKKIIKNTQYALQYALNIWSKVHLMQKIY